MLRDVADLAPPPRRARCPRCERPLPTCLCAWVRPVASTVEVLLLQHPQEAAQAKGSAQLLALSLAGCRVEVGEAFEAGRLGAWLAGPRGAVRLLYPAVEADGAPPDDAPHGPQHATALAPLQRLVVLDATWRKSLRMLLDHPALAALPRLLLQALPPTRYAPLRRARRPDQRSTLEATLLALRQADAASADEVDALLGAFDGWVAEQAAWAGR